MGRRLSALSVAFARFLHEEPDGFNVKCAGEEIDGLDANEAVAERSKAFRVANEIFRSAGDVDDALEPDGGKCLRHTGCKSLVGGVDDRFCEARGGRFGAKSVGCEHAFDGAAEKACILNAVTPCVDFGTGDRRRDDFYPERAAGALGTQERDRADPRIEVEKAVFGAEFKERERPLVKSRRLRCVHLQERFGTHIKREAFERRFDRFTPFNDVRGAFLKAEHGIAGVRVHVEGQMFEGNRRESRTNACNGGFRGPLAQDEAWKLPEDFRAKYPKKPLINSEPCYEMMGASRHVYVRFNDENCRASAWAGILAGATAGVTYGAHGIWNWQTSQSQGSVLGEGFDAPFRWQEVLQLPGVWDFGMIEPLLDALGCRTLVPAQDELADDREQIRVAHNEAERPTYLAYLPRATALKLGVALEGYAARAIDLAQKRIAHLPVTIADGATRVAQHPFCADALIVLEPVA